MEINASSKHRCILEGTNNLSHTSCPSLFCENYGDPTKTKWSSRIQELENPAAAAAAAVVAVENTNAIQLSKRVHLKHF